MKQAAWSLLALFFVSIPWAFAEAATPAYPGAISGTVKDASGRPLVGAIVSVYDSEVAKETLKSTKTDKQGYFVAENILPGSYLLRATAEGYKTALISTATVTPNKTAIFNFTLRRVSELISQQEEAESYRKILRRNRHIFQLEDVVVAQEKQQEDKTPFVSRPHGLLNLYTVSSFSTNLAPASYSAVDFAVAQMLSQDVELLISGQTGSGAFAPQRAEIETSILADNDHQVSFSLGYSHLPRFGSNLEKTRAINQYNFSVTDKWRTTDRIILLYGFDYTRFDGLVHDNQINPRLGLDFQLTGQDNLYASVYSPSETGSERVAEFETSKALFSDSVEPAFFTSNIPVEQKRRYEFGYLHTFKDRSQFETAVFFDNFVGRSVGLLSSNGLESSEEDSFSSISQNGSSRGIRFIFTKPISRNISTSVGYAFGQGQQFEVSPEGQPVLSVGYFHVLTGKVDTQIETTRTRVSTVLRFSSPRAIFAIDPFQQHLKTLDPNISIYIAQSVPMFDFVPGRWEAVLDVRNLLDRTYKEGDFKLAVGRYWRTVRGGISVRF
ncbi:MAG: TonB-dependent receptor [Blastocatellia bacterium]|nr:TonB-dependent receptor [Blastocatellia bacterium]